MAHLPLDDSTRAALEALSRRLGRSPEEIASRAIKDAVRDTEVLLDAIEEAKTQADEGRTMTLDEWRERKRRQRDTKV